MSRNATAGLIVLVLFVAAGCGDDEAAPADTAPSGVIESALVIEAGSSELPDARRASIRSGEATVDLGGYLTDEGAVAAFLADADAVARLVDGPATDVACTEQYGGPDIAHVVGSIDGRSVDTSFHRSDGCGINDWDQLQPILPPPVWSSGPDAAIGDEANPVLVPVGERFTIRLQANATTGYAWDITVPSGLDVVDDRYEEPDDIDMVGAGGAQVFVIEAAEVSAGVIELSYRQPFDADSEPAETRTFHVDAVEPD